MSQPRTLKDFCRWNEEAYPDIGPVEGAIPEKVDCVIVGAGIAGKTQRDRERDKKKRERVTHSLLAWCTPPLSSQRKVPKWVSLENGTKA